jgi:hypothetical protein
MWLNRGHGAIDDRRVIPEEEAAQGRRNRKSQDELHPLIGVAALKTGGHPLVTKRT